MGMARRRYAVKDTAIEYTHHSFSPWWGCQEVSEGCANCFARDIAHRFQKVKWGEDRVKTSESTWKQPLKWNKRCEELGIRERVLCGTMCDVFDEKVPQAWFNDLIELALECCNLDFLLLTKRPQNIRKRFEAFCEPALIPEAYMAEFWLGVSVENQKAADKRIPILLQIPAKVRFLSCEPLLGELDLSKYFMPSALKGCFAASGVDLKEEIHWVVAGGETGVNARPMKYEWAQKVKYQTVTANVPFYFKSWGKYPHDKDNMGDYIDGNQWKELPRL